MQRLWNLDPDQCRVVIARLTSAKFLRQSRDGTFVRDERPASCL
jgi:hypothetical protein